MSLGEGPEDIALHPSERGWSGVQRVCKPVTPLAGAEGRNERRRATAHDRATNRANIYLRHRHVGMTGHVQNGIVSFCWLENRAQTVLLVVVGGQWGAAGLRCEGLCLSSAHPPLATLQPSDRCCPLSPLTERRMASPPPVPRRPDAGVIGSPPVSSPVPAPVSSPAPASGVASPAPKAAADGKDNKKEEPMVCSNAGMRYE